MRKTPGPRSKPPTTKPDYDAMASLGDVITLTDGRGFWGHIRDHPNPKPVVRGFVDGLMQLGLDEVDALLIGSWAGSESILLGTTSYAEARRRSKLALHIPVEVAHHRNLQLLCRDIDEVEGDVPDYESTFVAVLDAYPKSCLANDAREAWNDRTKVKR
jgi:hypothetical protein